MRQTWLKFCSTAAVSAAILLSGCGTNGNSGVRFVNASPGLTGQYGVQVGVIGIAFHIMYGTEGIQPSGQYDSTDTSGAYRPVGAGTKQSVIIAGPDNSNVIASSSITLVKSTDYTVVAIGQYPNTGLLILTDNGTTPANGDAGLRVVHSSPNAGAVDVYVTAPGAPISGSPTVSNITFTNVTSYLPVPAGKYEIRVTPTGNPATVVIDVTTTLTGGGLYTAFALDPPAGSTNGKFGLLITGDAVTPASTK